MNIKELKEKIKDLPDNMDVFIRQENDEFTYSLSNDAKVLEIAFLEDCEDDEPDRAVADCFCISDY